MRIPLTLKRLYEAQGIDPYLLAPKNCSDDKHCGPQCLELLPYLDDWDSLAHASNLALRKYAERVINLIESGKPVPDDAQCELGRLHYEAHFFTMSKDVDIKAIWGEWSTEKKFHRGSCAILELEEYAAKCLAAAKTLDNDLGARVLGRKHIPGCPCDTELGSVRFLQYLALHSGKLHDMLSKVLRANTTMSATEMKEMGRLRYNSARMRLVLEDPSPLAGDWRLDHTIDQIEAVVDDPAWSRAAFANESDKLRSEARELINTVCPSSMIDPMNYSHKCSYINEEWAAVYGT